MRLVPGRLVGLLDQVLLLGLEESRKCRGHVWRLVLQPVLSRLYLRDDVRRLVGDVGLRAEQVIQGAEARDELVSRPALAIEVSLPSVAVSLELQQVDFKPRLQGMGSLARDTVPLLREALKDKDARLRAWAAAAPGIMGAGAKDAVPDLLDALHLSGAIDGELLIMRDRRVQSFNVLQQRLNRKTVTPKLMTEFPAHLRAYDLLADGGEDLRERPFAERRARLESFVTRLNDERVDLSSLVPFATWDELTAARKNPAAAGAGEDAAAVEGVMLKRRDAPYLPGRPKGPWWKWKRDPFIIDAVLMYAQRGHGKRSSYYSDYTFGVWTRGDSGEELVPVGKAYFGFTDEELLQIDRFVRRNTIDRFGPVREVVHEPNQGLVLEVAFEGLQRSTRHKSGLAMRFPRINRLRWDKPPSEADRLERLETMIGRIEQGHAS